MFKKVLIAFIVIIAVVIGTIYIYRHTIIRYYARKIIRENLPLFIKIEKIDFDFAMGKILFGDFKVLNPPGFSSEHLLKINSISCRYRIKGGFIPEGIEISDVLFKGADIEIERLKSGRINAIEMGSFISSLRGRKAAEAISETKIASLPSVARNDSLTTAPPGRKISDIIKLPASFTIKGARMAFLDDLPYDKPHLITVDSVNGTASISFGDDYSKILSLDFTLEGNLNDLSDEVIKWIAYLNPATPRLTMSNRFEVSNLDLLDFQPYYDKFSPFIFKKGRFSGTLVFDFDNGNIGSTNEIRLSDLIFYVKPGYEKAQMWESNVQDLMRYFTTTSGEVVFDFKLKGDMANPTPNLGPISKRAITSLSIDKAASFAIDQIAKQKDAVTGGGADNAKAAIGLFRNLINKK